MNKRQRKKWLKKHNKYVDHKDCWDLDITISKFIIPRLKIYRDETNGYPGIDDMDTYEKWIEALNKMINAFELTTEDFYGVWNHGEPYKDIEPLLNEKQKEVDEGLALFAKWYQHLWW